jgi:hypothetical protein
MVPARRVTGALQKNRRGELGADRAERVTDAVTDPRT